MLMFKDAFEDSPATLMRRFGIVGAPAYSPRFTLRSTAELACDEMGRDTEHVPEWAFSKLAA